MEILLLCTGNICRSPMAESMLRRALAKRGVEVEVHSAGLLAAGAVVTDHNLRVAEARGLDLTSHRSRQITADMVGAAGLVLAMARVHLREAVVLVPDAWPRAFTLKELVRRAEEAGPRPADVAVDEWIARLHDGRRRDELFGESPPDDVADPIGRPRRAYEAMAAELDELVGRLVDLLWPA